MRIVTAAAGHQILDQGVGAGFMDLRALVFVAVKTHFLLCFLKENRVGGAVNLMAACAADPGELMLAALPVTAGALFMAIQAALILHLGGAALVAKGHTRLGRFAVDIGADMLGTGAVTALAALFVHRAVWVAFLAVNRSQNAGGRFRSCSAVTAQAELGVSGLVVTSCRGRLGCQGGCQRQHK